MKFFYGSYTHPDAEVAFASVRRQIQYSPTQRANILRESWALKGKFVFQGATSQAQMFIALDKTRSVYSVNGYSAGMLDNNGNQTPFFLDNANAIGGVIVTNPVSHDKIEGAEGVTYLHYSFGLQMDSFLSNLNDLLSYTEQVSFSDLNGGPLQVARVPAAGLPIIQNVSTNSFYSATQQGSASSRNPHIQPEDMLWPNCLIGEDGARNISFTSPKMERGVPIEYGVSWSYRYRSIIPLLGTGSVHARG